jgi:hypothetical protein
MLFDSRIEDKRILSWMVANTLWIYFVLNVAANPTSIPKYLDLAKFQTTCDIVYDFVFSLLTSRSTTLLESIRASMFFCIVFMLSPSKLISTAQTSWCVPPVYGVYLEQLKINLLQTILNRKRIRQMLTKTNFAIGFHLNILISLTSFMVI